MRFDTFFDTAYSPGQLPNLIIDHTNYNKGVKAKHDLPANEVLVSINGPSTMFRETVAVGNKMSFSLQVGTNDFIKPAFPFQLFNHSCNPNCGINELLQLVTIRPIKTGETLCWDYSTSVIDANLIADCTCAETCCRKTIAGFELLPAALQQRYLDKKLVMPYIVDHINSNKINNH